MYIKNEDYNLMVKNASPNSKKAKDFIYAFAFGGVVCTIGELLRLLFIHLKISEKSVPILVAAALITVSAILTGLKLFQKISRIAGAGVLVPITGFANAVVSPAIEYRPEGFIQGVGVKIFSIAGPVILYGTLASVIYGVIYYVFTEVL